MDSTNRRGSSGGGAPGTEFESRSEEGVGDASSALRRRVLEYLETRDGAVPVRELAAQVAAREQDTAVSALDSTVRRRVETAVTRTVLPKLDEEGLVAYDRDRNVVRRTPLVAPPPDDADAPGDRPAGRGDGEYRWSLAYLAVTGGGLLVVAGGMWNLPLVGAMPEPLVGGVVLALFLVTAAVRLLYG